MRGERNLAQGGHPRPSYPGLVEVTCILATWLFEMARQYKFLSLGHRRPDGFACQEQLLKK